MGQPVQIANHLTELSVGIVRLPKTLSSFTETVTSTLKGTLQRKKKDSANKGLSIMNTVKNAQRKFARMAWDLPAVQRSNAGSYMISCDQMRKGSSSHISL